MSNRGSSQNVDQLSGTITGPVDAMWRNWLANQALPNLTAKEQDALRFCFYCSATSMYNTFLEVLRRDGTLHLLTLVTADIKEDVETYFSNTSNGHTMN